MNTEAEKVEKAHLGKRAEGTLERRYSTSVMKEEGEKTGRMTLTGVEGNAEGQGGG